MVFYFGQMRQLTATMSRKLTKTECSCPFPLSLLADVESIMSSSKELNSTSPSFVSLEHPSMFGEEPLVLLSSLHTELLIVIITFSLYCIGSQEHQKNCLWFWDSSISSGSCATNSDILSQMISPFSHLHSTETWENSSA